MICFYGRLFSHRFWLKVLGIKDRRSLISLTNECFLRFRAGKSSVSIKHPQEAVGLRKQGPGLSGTGKPPKNEKFEIPFLFLVNFCHFLKSIPNICSAFYKLKSSNVLWCNTRSVPTWLPDLDRPHHHRFLLLLLVGGVGQLQTQGVESCEWLYDFYR